MKASRCRKFALRTIHREVHSKNSRPRQTPNQSDPTKIRQCCEVTVKPPGCCRSCPARPTPPTAGGHSRWNRHADGRRTPRVDRPCVHSDTTLLPCVAPKPCRYHYLAPDQSGGGRDLVSLRGTAAVLTETLSKGGRWPERSCSAVHSQSHIHVLPMLIVWLVPKAPSSLIRGNRTAEVAPAPGYLHQ